MLWWEKQIRSKNTLSVYMITLIAGILCSALAATAQDGVVHAKAFPGSTVGLKATAALASCPTSTTTPCYVMLDPSLASWPTGTLPTPGTNQFLVDYRSQWAGGLPAGVASNGKNGLNITGDLVAAQTRLNSTSPGLLVIGDSIADGTGSTPSSPYPVNAWPYQLHLKVGGPLFAHPAFTRPGDQCEDMVWNRLYAKLNPQGAFLDPEFVFGGVTNDISQYNTDTNKQQIFERCIAGAYAYLTTPAANRVFAASGTMTGGFAADTGNTALQTGMGAKCSTNGCVDTVTLVTQIASSPVCFGYYAADGNGGTFTVKLNGTAQNDTFNGTTTWVAEGDDAELIATVNGGTKTALGACVPTSLAAGTTVQVAFTGTSATGAGNVVEPYWVSVPPLPSSANPDLVVVSANPRSDAFSALPPTFNAFMTSAIAAMPWANIHYADTYSAGLNIPTPITLPTLHMSGTYTAVAWVSDNGVQFANSLGQPGGSLTAVASSPQAGQYSEAAGVYSFSAADNSKPFFVNYSINCGSGSSATYFTNCGSDTIHPANPMHAVMATVIAAQIPSFKLQGVTAPNSAQADNPVAPIGLNPSLWPSDNPGGVVPASGSPFGYGRVKFDSPSGPVYDFYVPNIGNVHAYPTQLAQECWWAYTQTGSGGGPSGKAAPTAFSDCDTYRLANGIWNYTFLEVSNFFIVVNTPTVALSTAAIAGGACFQNGPIAENGAASTGVAIVAPNVRLSTVTGYGPGGLVINPPYIDAGQHVFVDVCNPTASPITPAALTLNVRWIN